MGKVKSFFNFLICIWLVILFAGCAQTTKHESTGQYVDDSVITTKVKSAILNEKSLKVFQINVKTYSGIVQLSGFVDSSDKVRKAGDIAESIEGVKDVKNDLIVK